MRPAWTGTFVLDSLLTRTTRYTSSTPRASRLRSRNRLRPIHRDGRTRRIRRSARSSSISLHGLGQRAWIRSSIRRSTSAGSEADQRCRSRHLEDAGFGGSIGRWGLRHGTDGCLVRSCQQDTTLVEDLLSVYPRYHAFVRMTVTVVT